MLRRILACSVVAVLLCGALAGPVSAQSSEEIIRATWPAYLEETAIGIAACESGLDPYATNAYSGAAGLFQFVPSTAYGMGLYDPYDPWANSAAAYDLYLSSGWSPWACAY